MKQCIALVFLCGLFSCSAYQTTSFQYTDGATTQTLPVVIPKGYSRTERITDEKGNTVQTYYYRQGQFYVAHMQDTASDIQPVLPWLNAPRYSVVNGAIVYKGMDVNDQYWREVRLDPLRAGYRFVTKSKEGQFDSATNYFLVLDSSRFSKAGKPGF